MKKLFFIIIFVLTLFVFKNNGFGNTQLDCPGLKNFKSWCGGEQIENEKLVFDRFPDDGDHTAGSILALFCG